MIDSTEYQNGGSATVHHHAQKVRSAARQTVYACRRATIKRRNVGPGLLEFMENSNCVPYSTNQNSLDGFKDALEKLWFDRVPTKNRKWRIYTSYSNGKRIMKGRALKKIHGVLNEKRANNILVHPDEMKALAYHKHQLEKAMLYGQAIIQQNTIDQ